MYYLQSNVVDPTPNVPDWVNVGQTQDLTVAYRCVYKALHNVHTLNMPHNGRYRIVQGRRRGATVPNPTILWEEVKT